MILLGLQRPQKMLKPIFLVQMFPWHISCLYSSANFMIRTQTEATLF